MKITFDNVNQNPNVDKGTTSYKTSSATKTNKQEAYALDISGTVTDNTAYGVHGRTTEDVMQSAGAQLSVDVARDYMTVMSNSMSTEDYSKMMENGFDPSDMDPEKVVTIVDHIKAEMAKSGDVISGYNDDLSKEKLAEITGNDAFAGEIAAALKKNDVPVTEENIKAVKDTAAKAEETKTLSDAAVKYMVENNLSCSVENLYYASFSAMGNAENQTGGYYAQEYGAYYAKAAASVDTAALNPQIEKAIMQMNLSGTKAFTEEEKADCMEQARWLLEKGIPLTEKTLNKLREVKSLKMPFSSEQILQSSAKAIAEGRPAIDATVGDDKSIYEQAADIFNKTNNISEAAICELAGDDRPNTLKNLFAVQESIDAEKYSNTNVIPYEETNEIITLKRQVAEVQLRMTIDANVKLLKSDYAIDTTVLEKLVDDLKSQETALKEQFFEGSETQTIEEGYSAFCNTSQVLKTIPYLPAAVIGRMALEGDIDTLSKLQEAGDILKTQYETAGTAYETLMTAPRSDMGDSIKKAFQNVDDILTDLNMDVSEDNRKAVRILGYNGMDINKENIKKVKNADSQVENIIKDITPAKTLQLIREGINPLTENLNALEKELKNMTEDPSKDTKKFAKYLYELEQNDAISESERGAYIGVYRLFHQLEKSDGSAVGSLVNQGAELTLGNLLSAIRSEKAKKINVTIDDSFGTLQETVKTGTSISDQIENGVLEARMAHSVYRDMTPKALSGFSWDENTTLEQLNKEIQNADTSESNVIPDEISDFQKAAELPRELYQYLETFHQPITGESLLAAEQLIANHGGYLEQTKKYLDHAKEDDKNKLMDTVNAVTEHFTDKDSAVSEMSDYSDAVTEILTEAMDSEADTAIDVKMLSLCHKQISMIKALSNEENYEVPVMLNGNLTSLNLTIIHDEEAKGCVSVTMDSKELGKTGARFYVGKETTEGIFVTQNEKSIPVLKEIGEAFTNTMNQTDGTISDIKYVVSKDLNLLTFGVPSADNNNTEVSTKALYQTAKQFLVTMQKVLS